MLKTTKLLQKNNRPVPAGSILFINTSNTEVRAPMVDWQTGKIDAGRIFNGAIRLIQTAYAVMRQPSILTSWQPLQNLKDTFVQRASLTHVTVLLDQQATVPRVLDLLQPHSATEKALKAKPSYEVDTFGLAARYIGPYPRLFQLLFNKMLDTLAKGEVGYHLQDALLCGLPNPLRKNLMQQTPELIFKERFPFVFSEGWKPSEDNKAFSLYCLQPSYLASLFSLVIILRLAQAQKQFHETSARFLLDQTHSKAPLFLASLQGLPQGADWQTLYNSFFQSSLSISDAELDCLTLFVHSLAEDFPSTEVFLTRLEQAPKLFSIQAWEKKTVNNHTTAKNSQATLFSAKKSPAVTSTSTTTTSTETLGKFSEKTDYDIAALDLARPACWPHR